MFTSWGKETAKVFTKEQLAFALEQLQLEEKYGVVLRAKGIVAGEKGWLHFDYVPGECDVRDGASASIGKICVIGAHIHDGDMVFVRRCETVENGKIAVVIIGEEATLKRVYYSPEKQQLLLMPENPAYQPMVYVGAELEQVHIMGQAVFVQSMLK